MSPVKTIIAISFAVTAVATSSALAQPAGNEYLPSVPKAGHHSGGGGSSSDTQSSSGTQTPSTVESSGTPSTPAPTQSSSDSAAKKHKEPAHKPEKSKAKAAPVQPVSASADTGGGVDALPVVLIAIIGISILLAGVVLRRRQRRRATTVHQRDALA
jgi:hypothetical protein